MTARTLPWADASLRTVRRGRFWVSGERVVRDGRTVRTAPLFVEWEAPGEVVRPFPVVLVHGGGFQGTEWFETPDGRPGWAQRLVEAGDAVLVVDRPGHGRSPLHTAVMAPMGPPFSYEGGRAIYCPGDDPRHTQWPFDPDDAATMNAFIAVYGPLPADLALSQQADADRIALLLDRIGPAILLTHSASGPSGWLAGGRPSPRCRARHRCDRTDGPPRSQPFRISGRCRGARPPRRSVSNRPFPIPCSCAMPSRVRNLPVLIVTAEASAFAAASPPTAAFLNDAGAAAELLHLPDHGVHGNGHGLIFERNSDAALRPVL